jgi:hypothetical protein
MKPTLSRELATAFRLTRQCASSLAPAILIFPNCEYHRLMTKAAARRRHGDIACSPPYRVR